MFCFSSCFSTVISWNPLLLPASPQLITGKTHRKIKPAMNIPTWNTQNICCKWPRRLLWQSAWRTPPGLQTRKADPRMWLQKPGCQFHFHKNRICAGSLCIQTEVLLYPAGSFCCSLLCFLSDLSGINETMAAQSLSACGSRNKRWERFFPPV